MEHTSKTQSSEPSTAALIAPPALQVLISVTERATAVPQKAEKPHRCSVSTPQSTGGTEGTAALPYLWPCREWVFIVPSLGAVFAGGCGVRSF